MGACAALRSAQTVKMAAMPQHHQQQLVFRAWCNVLIWSLAPLFRCSVCCDCAHYAESSEAIQHQLIKLNEKLSETSEHNLKLAALVLKRLPDQAALLQTQVGVVERSVVRSDRTGTGTLWDW